MSPQLPAFVEPMLAKRGAPFDSDEHLFEIKWDGIRALTFAEGRGYRLASRRRTDLLVRYPELGFLAGLEAGLVLDGELVCLRHGKPDFSAVLRREQARSTRRIDHLARTLPVTYVVFDLLYLDYESRMDLGLEARRELLQDVLAGRDEPRLVLSEGVVGNGLDFFEHVHAMALEGMVAKRLSSRYEAGLRTGAWTKVKQEVETVCAILGFLPEGEDDLKSLIVATHVNGELRHVGRVGSGLTHPVRRRLRRLLDRRLRPEPWLECDASGTWIEPGLYCKVSYLEITKSGSLRAPVFLELISEDD